MPNLKEICESIIKECVKPAQERIKAYEAKHGKVPAKAPAFAAAKMFKKTSTRLSRRDRAR